MTKILTTAELTRRYNAWRRRRGHAEIHNRWVRMALQLRGVEPAEVIGRAKIWHPDALEELKEIEARK